MPTGYTAKLSEGEQSFKDFVIGCMGAFCLSMRDCKIGEIKFPEVRTYHKDRIEESKARLDELRSMSIKDVRDKARREYVAAYDRHVERLEEIESTEKRYKDMYKKVKKWHPPTSTHYDIKKFMLNQLKISMDIYRPNEPEALDGEAWIKRELEMEMKALRRNTAELAKEEDRVKEGQDWMNAILNDLEKE